ncbi:MAG: hypothetical protein DA405_10440, partial [Bacteroidetes bacterium]
MAKTKQENPKLTENFGWTALKKLSPLIFLTVFACAPQAQIKTFDLAESSYSREIHFEPINSQITIDSLEITITPIAPSAVDSLFYEEYSKSGQMKYFRQNFNVPDPPKHEYTIEDIIDYEPLVKALDKLLDAGQITPEERTEFLGLIEPKDMEEEESDGKDYYLHKAYNPYFLGGKYLSTFKIEFSNKSSHFKTFHNNLQVITNGQLLEPLSSDFLAEELQLNAQGNIRYSQTLERFNLKDSLIIAPSAKFDKYFALLPISFDSTIEISLPKSKEVFKYSFSEDVFERDTIYTYYIFPLNSTYHGGNEIYYKNYIIYDTEAVVFLKDNKLHVSAGDLNKTIKMSWLSINKKTSY